jgi:hypothetical protein
MKWLTDEAPRGVLRSHHGFVELRAFAINRLRQTRSYEFSPWNAVSPTPNPPTKKLKPARDPLHLARYYQSLLDSGKFESRAALARYLGVSRARVTQVLNRLEPDSSAQAATG